MDDTTRITAASRLNANAARAIVEAMAMAAENSQRERRGESMAYTDVDFFALIDKNGIGWNDVMNVL